MSMQRGCGLADYNYLHMQIIVDISILVGNFTTSAGCLGTIHMGTSYQPVEKVKELLTVTLGRFCAATVMIAPSLCVARM